jgi:uncharacterized protein YbaR (Trm112 family)
MMTIVKCPKCKKRYDPGVDEALDDIGDMPGELSVKVVCPACGQWLRLPENEPIPAPAVPPAILKEMMSQSRLVDSDEAAPLNKARSKPKEQRPWWKFW